MIHMQEYTREMRRTFLQMMAWGIFICGTAYFTGNGWRVPGLVLGIGSSILYFLLLWYRVLKSTDMPVHKAILYMRIGWLIRVIFVIMALFLSLKLPNIDFVAAVVGLFTLQIVIVGNAVIFVVKNLLNSK